MGLLSRASTVAADESLDDSTHYIGRTGLGWALCEALDARARLKEAGATTMSASICCSLRSLSALYSRVRTEDPLLRRVAAEYLRRGIGRPHVGRDG